MPASIEDRIERLLDQLEDPNLTSGEIQKIREKIDFLDSMKE